MKLVPERAVCTNEIIGRYQQRRTISYMRVWAVNAGPSMQLYAFSDSLGRVPMSFRISLSLSPTTIAMSARHSSRNRILNAKHSIQHTSSGVHPVDRHRCLEQALIRLELLERVGSTGSICNHTASLGRAKVFEDAGQLIGGRSGLLNICDCTLVSLQSTHATHCIFPSLFHVPRVKSVLSSLLCLLWSAAWSWVAVAEAFATVCLRSVWARIEAGVEGWWKRVMTSFLAD